MNLYSACEMTAFILDMTIVILDITLSTLFTYSYSSVILLSTVAQ